MTCREKGCYLSCKFLDLCLSKVHRSIQCCCMIICTVFKPSFWQRGLCREQWSCGGTGVGDTAQFWLTVSQYVEWGSMRCEITGPLLPLPQMIPGTPFLPSPVTERGGGGGRSSRACTAPPLSRRISPTRRKTNRGAYFSSRGGRGGGGGEVQSGLDYAHKENASQVPLTFSNNGCLWFMSQRDCFYFSQPPGNNIKKHKCYYECLW